MNSLNLDHDLRKAFNQQTYQRLLAESSQARSLNSVSKRDKYRHELKQYSLRSKIRIVSQVVHDAASIIGTILKARSNSANA